MARGLAFEGLLDRSCDMYKSQRRAIINKRPTPVKILGTNGSGMIRGYLEKPSTVDYDGVYRGKSIVFEAKSCKELNRFPLKNVEQHQYDYLIDCHDHGAISFLLIEFAAHRTVYLLPAITLKSLWTGATASGVGKGSIALDDLETHAQSVRVGRVPVDYLATVDKVWGDYLGLVASNG